MQKYKREAENLLECNSFELVFLNWTQDIQEMEQNIAFFVLEIRISAF